MASTVDIAGALAAIEKRLSDNWTTTKILFDNTDPPTDEAWPPVDADQKPVPWVYCELVDIDARIVAFGTPGNQTVMDTGLIKLWVMVQKGSGLEDARAKATALGEIFRQQKFFDTDPTAYVRTFTPRVGNDPMISDDGNTVAGACCTVRYEFTHRA